MNNEPVAWTTKFPKTVQDFSFYQTQIYTEPLYSHPVKEPLTDDELFHVIRRIGYTSIDQTDEIVEAIRKAQEK